MVVFCSLGQWNGISTLAVYAVTIFQMTKSTVDPYVAPVIIAVVS